MDVTRDAMVFFAAVAPDVRQQEHLTNLIRLTHGSRYGMSDESVDGLKRQSQKGMRERWRTVTPVDTLVAMNDAGHMDLTSLGRRLTEEMLDG